MFGFTAIKMTLFEINIYIYTFLEEKLNVDRETT